MIPIRELQIGNLVLYNGLEAIVYSITGAYPSKVERFNNKPTVDLVLGGLITATEDELEPIILTKEIFDKLDNFEYKYNAYWFEGVDFQDFKSNNEWVCFPLFDAIDAPLISSLHELQNIILFLRKKQIL